MSEGRRILVPSHPLASNLTDVPNLALTREQRRRQKQQEEYLRTCPTRAELLQDVVNPLNNRLGQMDIHMFAIFNLLEAKGIVSRAELTAEVHKVAGIPMPFNEQPKVSEETQNIGDNPTDPAN